MRDALFAAFRRIAGGYDLIAAYNLVDGMVFADADEGGAMAGLFDEIVRRGERCHPAQPGGHALRPARPEDPLDHALQAVRTCLVNCNRACAFIFEYASQLLHGPTNLQFSERVSFLRLVKSAGESQMVPASSDGRRRTAQNLLIVVCDRLTDLPAWVYLNNPFSGSVEKTRRGHPSGGTTSSCFSRRPRPELP